MSKSSRLKDWVVFLEQGGRVRKIYISIDEVLEILQKHYGIMNIKFMTREDSDRYSECYCRIDFISGEVPNEK